MDFLKLIKEGRVEDFKSKYGQKFLPANADRIVANVSPKFLNWVGKTFDAINFEENFVKLVAALKKFEKISSNLPKTDINQYGGLSELLSSLSEYENKSRRSVKKVQGGNVVYEDERFFIVNPLTHEASCYYGKGTKWCTAADSNHQFNQYNQDGKLFYILDKSLPTNDPFYKVALLKKFEGDMTFYDAQDNSIKGGKWIAPGEKFDTIVAAIDKYLESEYAEQLKIWRDKELAKKEKERLYRLSVQRILRQREEEAQERRVENEWALGPDCPEEGIKAHALLNWLVDNNEVEVLTNEDRAEIQRLQSEIEELQSEYDNSEDVRTDLLDEISDLEDEIESLSDNKIDVYNIIPVGTHYDTTEFEVINSDVDGRRYAVGDEDEMQSSSYEAVERLVDDIGYEGFNASFARSYIDTDAVVSHAEETYENDVMENPDAYFDDDDRMLSDEQQEKIEILKQKTEKTKIYIQKIEAELDGTDDDEAIEEKIEELNELIEEYIQEIEEIEENPEGDFPRDMIDEKVEDLVSEVRRDPEWYMNDFGLDWEYYIDKDEFIQGVIDTDGYGHSLGTYDGNADEVRVNDQLFYVMRID
jgi:predicted  nucleic acid-binding Zn-ribbon protein